MNVKVVKLGVPQPNVQVFMFRGDLSEAFLKNNKVINMLRLKASYGETGAASGALETDAYTYFNYVTDNRYMNWTGARVRIVGKPSERYVRILYQEHQQPAFFHGYAALYGIPLLQSQYR